jgi:hypothetical protein
MVEHILESKIQRQIILWLEAKGWYVVKILQTTKNGWPDLQALKLDDSEYYPKSKIIFIEVKRPGQKPTPLQLIRHEELRSRGFHVIVADSLESLIEQI